MRSIVGIGNYSPFEKIFTIDIFLILSTKTKQNNDKMASEKIRFLCFFLDFCFFAFFGVFFFRPNLVYFRCFVFFLVFFRLIFFCFCTFVYYGICTFSLKFFVFFSFPLDFCFFFVFLVFSKIRAFLVFSFLSFFLFFVTQNQSLPLV